MSINLLPYAIATTVIAAELAYGSWLLNLPSPHHRARGYEVIYSAIESCVTGAVLALILTSAPSLLKAFGLNYLEPTIAVAHYVAARDRYTNYVVDLANVARDLTLTGIFSPLASTWFAASGLANIFTSYLVALSSALLIAARFCELFGSTLASLGIMLSGVSRVRRLGVSLAVSVVSLEVVVGAAAPHFLANAQALKFKYAGIPLSGIAQYFAGAVDAVLQDAKIMGEFAAWVSIALSVAGAVSTGVAVAAGGLSETIVSRLRV